MFQLKVQQYLSNHSLEDLKREFFIEYRIKNDKVSLNYDQISSPMDQEICQECRGLILRNHTWEIVSYPFKKFFNQQESFAAKIDIKNAVAYEKHDGTMIHLYYDESQSKWCIATRSASEADIPTQVGLTFVELTLEALSRMGIDIVSLWEKLNKRYTYIFELTCPHNTVVVSHDDYCLTLLGVRDLVSLKELPIEDIAKEIGFPIPKKFNFSSYDDLSLFLSSWNGSVIEHEGLVLVDKDFNRVKVKTECYIAAHGLISSLVASDRNIIRLILDDKADDLSFVKDHLILDKVNSYKEKIKALIIKANEDYEKYKNIESDKEFALSIKELPYKHALFALRRNKYNSVLEFFKANTNNSGVDSLKDILEQMIS